MSVCLSACNNSRDDERVFIIFYICKFYYNFYNTDRDPLLYIAKFSD
jgi:hypothetical protein